MANLGYASWRVMTSHRLLGSDARQRGRVLNQGKEIHLCLFI